MINAVTLLQVQKTSKVGRLQKGDAVKSCCVSRSSVVRSLCLPFCSTRPVQVHRVSGGEYFTTRTGTLA